jgi:hypothetical protein
MPAGEGTRCQILQCDEYTCELYPWQLIILLPVRWLFAVLNAEMVYDRHSILIQGISLCRDLCKKCIHA